MNAKTTPRFWIVWVAATLIVAAALIGLLTLVKSFTQQRVVISVAATGWRAPAVFRYPIQTYEMECFGRWALRA